MTAEEKISSNRILLLSIMENLTSQELLPHRLVCKSWRDAANHLVRRRQHEFFFSPTMKTRTMGAYNDHEWMRSWANALQISFIYSPWRDAFVRASHRLIETTYSSLHLEASTLGEEGQRIESAFFKETEDFFTGQIADPSIQCNVNSKMAGSTIDHLTDFLESILRDTDRKKAQGENFEDPDAFRHSNFPFLSFRFECGRLWGRPEIFRFFKVMGPKIRYLTVGLNHMCRGSPESPWYRDSQWDHDFAVFRQVPNLQVLTVLVMEGRWMEYICEGSTFVDPHTNQPPANVAQVLQVDEKNQVGPFENLKCLRVHDFAHGDVGNYVRWIMIKAKKLDSVIFEMGFAPYLLSFLGDVDYGETSTFELSQCQNKPETCATRPLPTPVRQIVPITTLCLNLFKESAQLIKYIAQVINLQQLEGGQSRLKTLHLRLKKLPKELPDSATETTRSPYNSPIVPPLLEILNTGANSLETMGLAGGAGVFLQGLLQKENHFHEHNEGTRLKGFVNVRTLFVCIEGTTKLRRRDFQSSLGVQLDHHHHHNLVTSSTSLSKVFPRVNEISLGFYPLGMGGNEEYASWIPFLSHPDLLCNQQTADSPETQTQIRGHGEVTEVKSVNKLRFGPRFPRIALDVWKFSRVQTLCLNCNNFFTIAPAIWTLVSLESIVIDRLVADDEGESVAPKLDAALTGLPIEIIEQWTDDLEKGLLTVSRKDRQKFLDDKRATFRSLITADAPSIFNLSDLRHLKFIVDLTIFGRATTDKSFKRVFSPLSGLLVFELLSPSSHITVWVQVNEDVKEPPTNYDILETAFDPTVFSHPRVTVREIRGDNCMKPHCPF